MSGIVAWRGGKSWSSWHLVGADLFVTLCGLAVPTKPLNNISRTRGRSKEATCATCLRVLDQKFSQQEA